MDIISNYRPIIKIFLFLGLFLHFNSGYSQIFDQQSQSSQSTTTGFSNPTAFVFGAADGVNIEVSLWGYVKAPGLYRIPHTTDLVSLISLAGGPLPDARLDDVRIIRLVQEGSSEREKLITVSIEKFIESGDRQLIPVLKPGDVVVMSGSAYSVFQSFVGFVRDVALILNTVFIWTRLNRGN